MLILFAMLLMGLLAVVWGFMMCLLPRQWGRLTDSMVFADRWTVARPTKRQHPLLSFGNRIAGIVIFAVGCWFAYFAGLEIYRVLVEHAAVHPVSRDNSVPASFTPSVILFFSILVTLTGAMLAAFPARAMSVLERVWPATRSLAPSAVPKMTLFIRIFGAALAILALMSLTH